ncbi:MAG: cell division protein FtsZ [Gammaproteobacteria bacterium]|jgi:cell division protein FtsZ
MTNKFEIVDACQEAAEIKVIGVGGGGGNAVQHMLMQSIDGVDFICANTDAQALSNSTATTLLQLGNTITKGLGAGANPNIGREAALEDRERIQEMLQGTDMAFITAGMGGGTGTGAAPVIAEIAKDMGILTVAVVTKPFFFELKRRMAVAEEGILELEKHVDSLIIVPNEKLLTNLPGSSLKKAFAAANDVLSGAVQGIAELITRRGLINVDFADVRTVMSEKGKAMMGSGQGTGPDRAREAAMQAVASPLLEDVDLSGARGILVNITANDDLGLDEFAEVNDVINEFASQDATMVVGTVFDDSMTDELRVSVVATGLGQTEEPSMKVAVENPEPVSDKPLDYNVYDKPAAIRQRENLAQDGGKRVVGTDLAEDFLDIPAFLRRQAD